MKLQEEYMTSIIIKVSGMHCTGCEALVEEMVEELDGVKKVKPDFKKATVEVEYDEAKVLPDDIRKKIVEAGYTPE